jgi:MFS family permease
LFKGWDILFQLYIFQVSSHKYLHFIEHMYTNAGIAYARSLNLSPLQGSIIVAVLNTASVPGVVLLSALCDRFHVSNVMLLSTLGSAISVFLLWGLSSSSTALPLLIIFALTYGFFAGGFTATYAGIVRELRRVSPPGAADLGSIFGLLSAGRGIGNIVCGPVSELLLRDGGGRANMSNFAYGTSYSPLVIFTGVTALVAITPWATRKLHVI